MNQVFTDRQIETYSLQLLKWAYGKTGSHTAAEEVAQEVWVQLYHSLRRAEENGAEIVQPERYLWKVARYVWCRHLRNAVYCCHADSIDDHPHAAEDTDHAREHADAEENAFFLQKLRRGLMELNRLQREIMIRFYMEQQTQKQIAAELGVTVSAVKWHLFDTRQRLKEDLMENNEFVYRPRKMLLSISGKVESFDTINGIQFSLSRQNICFACYRKSQSIESLSRMLGIPQEYVENDVKWLLDRELLAQSGNLYRTDFRIESGQEAQDQYAVYLKLKSELSDVMVQELMAAEDKIRSIGFVGSERPMKKLLWLLIYRLADTMWNEEKEAEPPIRKDGGVYHTIGFDTTPAEHVVLDTRGWKKNGTMNSGEGFYWFGTEYFDFAEPVHLFMNERGEWKRLIDTLRKILNSVDDMVQLSEEERYDVSVLIEKGFLLMENGRIVPNFCVFTKLQYQQLKTRVFWPIARKLQPIVQRRDAELEALCRSQLPEHLAYLLPFAAQMARYNLGFLTTFFAHEDGWLHHPQDEKEGSMLTLMYIKPE